MDSDWYKTCIVNCAGGAKGKHCICVRDCDCFICCSYYWRALLPITYMARLQIRLLSRVFPYTTSLNLWYGMMQNIRLSPLGNIVFRISFQAGEPSETSHVT